MWSNSNKTCGKVLMSTSKYTILWDNCLGPKDSPGATTGRRHHPPPQAEGFPSTFSYVQNPPFPFVVPSSALSDTLSKTAGMRLISPIQQICVSVNTFQRPPRTRTHSPGENSVIPFPSPHNRPLVHLLRADSGGNPFPPTPA